MAVRSAVARSAPVGVREATDREIINWDHLVERFTNHRITHQRCWLRFLENSVGGTPLFLVFEKDAEIVGCLPGLLTAIGPVRLFGSPLAGWQTAAMGPVFDPNRVDAAELMAAAVGILEREYRVHHIELISTHLARESMSALGFQEEAAPTFRGPLYPGDEDRSSVTNDSSTRPMSRSKKSSREEETRSRSAGSACSSSSGK
jgi:hypothetical protein